MKLKNRRYPTLDLLRGFCVLSMIAYHFIWDLVYMIGISFPWFSQLPGEIWQLSISLIFILLAGCCQVFNTQPLRHGLIVFAAGLFITAVTLFFMPETPVIFGILTGLGTMMILVSFLTRLLKRLPPIPGIILSLLLFLLFFPIRYGFLLGGWKIPEFLYQGYLMTFLGFPDPTFISADYYPFFPWIFLFICGFLIGRILQEKSISCTALSIHFSPLEWVGQHSLLIYLIHQPVLYGYILLLIQNGSIK